MATIKPAIFPRVEDTPSVRATQPARPVREATPADRPARPAPGGVGQANAGRRPVDGRQQKLETAIETLRSKSVELYKPNRTKARQSAPLGQVIDIKA